MSGCTAIAAGCSCIGGRAGVIGHVIIAGTIGIGAIIEKHFSGSYGQDGTLTARAIQMLSDAIIRPYKSLADRVKTFRLCR